MAKKKPSKPEDNELEGFDEELEDEPEVIEDEDEGIEGLDDEAKVGEGDEDVRIGEPGEVEPPGEGELMLEMSGPGIQPVAMVFGHALLHNMNLSEYLLGEIEGLDDHHGLKGELQAVHDQHVQPAIEHLKGALDKHYPEHGHQGVLEVLRKSEGGSPVGGEATPGEAGMVGQGYTSPNSAQGAIKSHGGRNRPFVTKAIDQASLNSAIQASVRSKDWYHLHNFLIEHDVPEDVADQVLQIAESKADLHPHSITIAVRRLLQESGLLEKSYQKYLDQVNRSRTVQKQGQNWHVTLVDTENKPRGQGVVEVPGAADIGSATQPAITALADQLKIPQNELSPGACKVRPAQPGEENQQGQSGTQPSPTQPATNPTGVPPQPGQPPQVQQGVRPRAIPFTGDNTDEEEFDEGQRHTNPRTGEWHTDEHQPYGEGYTRHRRGKSMNGEEILERFQGRDGQWYTRVVGYLRKSATGKIYLVKTNGLGRVRPLVMNRKGDILNPTDHRLREPEFGGKQPRVNSPTPKKPHISHSVLEPGDEKPHDVEWLKGITKCPVCKGIGCSSCGGTGYMKALDSSQALVKHAKVISDATGIMEKMLGDEAVPKHYKGVLKFHSDRLGRVSKALTNMGKLQHSGGKGKPLTDTGKIQHNSGKGSELSDEGEREGDTPKVVEGMESGKLMSGKYGREGDATHPLGKPGGSGKKKEAKVLSSTDLRQNGTKRSNSTTPHTPITKKGVTAVERELAEEFEALKRVYSQVVGPVGNRNGN